MNETVSTEPTSKTPMRCVECDREMENYNEFVSPTNEKRIVCWECQMREEKNFFAKRDFSRRSRRGVIPR
jgi:hypothetical protein